MDPGTCISFNVGGYYFGLLDVVVADEEHFSFLSVLPNEDCELDVDGGDLVPPLLEALLHLDIGRGQLLLVLLFGAGLEALQLLAELSPEHFVLK